MRRLVAMSGLALSGLVWSGLLWSGLVWSGCAPSPEVATVRVERQHFVHSVRAEGTLVAERATSILVPAEVEPPARIAWLAADGIEVEAGQVIVRFDDVEMSRQLDEGRADFESSRLKADKAEAEGESQLVGIDGDRKVAELELGFAERFQKTDDEVFSRFEIQGSAIDGALAADRKESSVELAGIQRSVGQNEQDLLEIEKGRAAQRVDRARAGLRALEVRAPHSGFLTWLRDWRGEPPQVGQQVWRGQPMAQIPELDRMKAEVFVLEADAGGIAVGQRAAMRIEAHPQEVWEAKVRRVDTVARPRERGSPIQYFGVELELERTDSSRMRPGQRVVATLLLEERADALVLPRQALVFPKDVRPEERSGAERDDAAARILATPATAVEDPERSSAYVWVLEGDRFERREIELGPRSTALVVVEAGLTAGDVVALEPPGAAHERGGESPDEAADAGGE